MSDKKNAFTIIELILVLAIVSLAGFLFVPVAANEFRRNDLTNTARRISSDIFVQQQNAYSGLDDSSFGISFAEESYTLFTGNNLASATETQVKELPFGISIESAVFNATGNELRFNQGDYRPVGTGSIVLTSGSSSINLIINSSGVINL